MNKLLTNKKDLARLSTEAEERASAIVLVIHAHEV